MHLMRIFLVQDTVRHELFKYQKSVLGKSLDFLNISYILLVSNTAEYNTVNMVSFHRHHTLQQ